MVARRTFLVTGTDTDIGKTYSCRVLAGAFARSGPVACMKPVQTGCSTGDDGRLVAPDYEAVIAAGAVRVCDTDVHVPYRFSLACSPHLAARTAGVTISLDRICRCFNTLRARHGGVVLVEGAGGLMAPLSDGVCIIDLAARLDVPLVLVAGLRLGTLNHTALSVETIRARGLKLAGVIANEPSAAAGDGFIRNDNLAMISRMAAPAPTFHLRHGQGPDEQVEEFCRAIST